MERFPLFALGSLLIFMGIFFVPMTISQTTGGDWQSCKNGSELFDPPDCPDDDPQKPVYFPFPYDCTQYYECTNNIARCMKCAPGTIWDQERTVCNHPSAVNCTIVTTTMFTGSPTVRPSTTELPETTEEPTEETTEATSEPTFEPTTEEPTEPTTEDWSWTTTEEPTTEATTEDWSWTTTEEPTTEATTEDWSWTTVEDTTEFPQPTTTEDPDDPINWVCPENYVGLIRHPFDCRLFYNCDPGFRPCLFECQSNLYFNPAIGGCDYPASVPDCVDGSPPPPASTPGIKPDSGNPINYRNINRFNIAQNVRFVSALLQRENRQDPCASIKAHL